MPMNVADASLSEHTSTRHAGHSSERPPTATRSRLRASEAGQCRPGPRPGHPPPAHRAAGCRRCSAAAADSVHIQTQNMALRARQIMATARWAGCRLRPGTPAGCARSTAFATHTDSERTHFGFEDIPIDEKVGKVKQVFKVRASSSCPGSTFLRAATPR